MGLSGADLELLRMQKEAGIDPLTGQGYDGAYLEQLGDLARVVGDDNLSANDIASFIATPDSAIETALSAKNLEAVQPGEPPRSVLDVAFDPRQSGLWIPGSDLAPTLGTPAPAVFNNAPVTKYSPAVQQRAAIVFTPPAWWTSINVALIVGHEGGSGDVRWRTFVGSIGVPGGVSIGTDDTVFYTVQSVNAAYRVSHPTTWTTDPAKKVLISVERTGNSSLDTDASPISVIGVEITQGA